MKQLISPAEYTARRRRLDARTWHVVSVSAYVALLTRCLRLEQRLAMTGDKDDEAIQRAVIHDAPDALLIRELERRGYTVIDGQLPFVWEDEATTPSA